jgi:hypothetical protein
VKRAPLKRRKPLRRRARNTSPALQIDARRLWRQAVLRSDGYRCVLAPSGCTGALQAHHPLPQQLLKREGYADRLWAVENGLTLCEGHHMAFERSALEIPAALLHPETWTFARSLGLAWYLERTYMPRGVCPHCEADTVVGNGSPLRCSSCGATWRGVRRLA